MASNKSNKSKQQIKNINQNLNRIKDSQIRVKFVKWGFATRFEDNEVYVNRNFKKHPQMLRKILKHEAEHDEGSNTKHDIIHDLTINSQIGFGDMILFMIRYPTTFAQVLPLRYSKERGLIYDINSIMWWVFIIIGILIGLKIFL